MDTLSRVIAVTIGAGLLPAGLIVLTQGVTILAVSGALGAAIPVGMIYALLSLEESDSN